MDEKQGKRQFDKAFKISAVKMVEEGEKVSEVARSLGIHENLIYAWKSVEVQRFLEEMLI